MRLFVALPLPAEPAAHLAAALGRDPDPRWHLTLAFLGEQPSAAPYAEALAQVAGRPFRLALAGGGTFGGRVLWADVGAGRAELVALAGRVQDACRAAGAALEDRPYRPHVTLRRGRDLDAAPLAAYAGPVWTVEGPVLLESRGGRYLPVD